MSSPSVQKLNTLGATGSPPKYVFCYDTLEGMPMWSCSVAVPGFEKFDCKAFNADMKIAKEQAAAELLEFLTEIGHPGLRDDPQKVEEKFRKYFGYLARCEENFCI